MSGYVFTNLGAWEGGEPGPDNELPITTLHGVSSPVHLSNKPAVANQVRIMRSRPRFVVRRRRQARQASPPEMPTELETQGDRPGTFQAWGQGHPYSRGRSTSPLWRPTQFQGDRHARIVSRGVITPMGDSMDSPPRTSAPTRNFPSSRKGTAYSRVDFIDESEDEVDFVAEASFSYTVPRSQTLKTGRDEQEDNPFTEALREAARHAIMNRIAELQAKVSPQKMLTGRQMKQTTTALKYVSAELRANKEFMLQQVLKDPKALQHADETLKNDAQVVLAAVKQNGLCLELASKEMRNNPDIVLTAVRQRGRALKFASDTLKDTMGVVKAAIEKEGDALFFASDRLKRDREMAMAALASDGDALRHLSTDLRKVTLALVLRVCRLQLIEVHGCSEE